MLFIVTSASLLLWITAIVAEEDCIIPSILNGVAGKYMKIRYSRIIAFKKVDEGTKVNENDEVYLRCSEGYEVSGSNQNETKINCSEGRWSQKFHCTPASCDSDRPLTIFGRVEEVEVNSEHGGSITYKCLPDHIMKRDGNVTCQYGEWKGRPPSCRSIKCDTDSLQFTGVMKVPNQFFYDDEEYNYTCEFPLYRKPEHHNGIVLCTNGMWQTDFPMCIEKRCFDIPPTVEHGNAIDLSTINGSVVNYTCEDPYVLIGDSVVQCIYGDWVGEPPECRDTRCSTDLLQFTGVKKVPNEFFYDDEEFNYTCESPRYRKPENHSGIALCKNGMWQTAFPVCSETRCATDSLQFTGVKKVPNQFFFEDEQYNYTCESPRYRKPEDHSGVALCKTGIWQTVFPLCIEKRCSDQPPMPEHGGVLDLSTATGSVVNYSCEEPYVLVGDSVVQCIYGDWVGEPPECRDSRCYIEDLGNLANISPTTEASTLSGNKLDVECEEGYSVNDELPTCENGFWSTYLSESLCKEITCEVPKVSYGRLKQLVYQEYEYSYWQFKYPSYEYFRVITPGNTVPSDAVLYLCCENGYSFRGSGAQIVETQCFKGRWFPYPECHRHAQYKKRINKDHQRFSKPWEIFE